MKIISNYEDCIDFLSNKNDKNIFIRNEDLCSFCFQDNRLKRLNIGRPLYFDVAYRFLDVYYRATYINVNNGVLLFLGEQFNVNIKIKKDYNNNIDITSELLKEKSKYGQLINDQLINNIFSEKDIHWVFIFKRDALENYVTIWINPPLKFFNFIFEKNTKKEIFDKIEEYYK